MFGHKKTLASVAVATFALLPFLADSVTASPSPSKTLKLFKRQQQDPNTPLVLVAPACDFFQCSINITQGQELTATWLNAPEGTVALDLREYPRPLLRHPSETNTVISPCDPQSPMQAPA